MARSWTHQRRQQLAAEKLAALGVPVPPGLTPATVWRRLGAEQRKEGVRRLGRRQPAPGRPRYHGGGRNVVTPRTQIIETASGMRIATVTRTTSRRAFVNAIRDAATRGDYVAILATFDSDRGPRSKWITGTPAQHGQIADTAAMRGHPPGAPAPRGTPKIESQGHEPLGPVQVVAGSAANVTDGGISAQILLAYLRDYEDPWDAIYDLWEAEPSG